MSFIEVYLNSTLQNTVEVESDVLSIGRTPDNSICLDSKYVSAHHAVITQKQGYYFIEDFNSRNGTSVNGKELCSKQSLFFYDNIEIGKHTLKFVKASGGSHVNKGNSYFLVYGESRGINKLLLRNLHYSIGKAEYNNLCVGGLLTPNKIAEIDLIGDNYYLSILKEGLVKINGVNVDTKTMLANDDNIKIKKMTLKFLQEH